MCSPPEGIDFVWLDEADFSMGKDIPTAWDECGLSLETVSPAWMFQEQTLASAEGHIMGPPGSSLILTDLMRWPLCLLQESADFGEGGEPDLWL